MIKISGIKRLTLEETKTPSKKYLYFRQED